ncbi:MAG: CvpA family protein [Candidatus Omnitrophota bacterium]
MFSSIITNINWVDICLAILLLRICYIAVKNGFPQEVFKIFGVIAAVFLSMHYYLFLSELIRDRLGLGLESTALRSLEFFVFLTLVILSQFFFVILRKIFSKALKVEVLPTLNKWGGFILGVARGLLLGSLLMFIMLLSGADFLNKGVKESYSGKYIVGVAPAVYCSLWQGFLSKLFTGDKLNDSVLEVQ